MKTIEERAREEAPLFPYGFDEYEANYRREEFMDGYIQGATEQRAIDKEEAHKAFVELLAVQYGEDCDESMHQYIDDVLKKYMEE